ncbi:MAG TPA: endonuclease/exonuclease/phosphatase family protein [Gaiellaceae bacterium]|nr:endonuclease/exonuclease/phosphatase family protein [Gaiellaceae bacterium]
MVIRTWNLFHGNTVPPGRRAYLREMVELITADRPDIVCLQELPGWALSELEGWSRMSAIPVLVRGASLGPLSIPAGLGRALTAPHHGIIRSAFEGQGMAILVSRELELVSSASTGINDPVRGREPRAAQLVELQLPNSARAVVLNTHITNAGDPAVCDAELERAIRWLGEATPEGAVTILAGDFNVTPERSSVIPALTPPFSAAFPNSIDQILVRGAQVETARVWPEDDRSFGHRLLSDHAPLEVTLRVGE